ncbi:MAG TPA: hypothetical protein VNV85_15100 [Puia sp.]|nr:hypothetical protein [Puia sp.]
MDETVYKLFQLRPAPISWEVLFERIKLAIDVEETKKEKWKEAVDFLKIELGNGFFKNCGIDHPVANKLNSAPGRLDDLLGFFDTLQKLKAMNSNYPYLIAKLKRREECKSEGIFFTEIAKQLLQNDFQVHFIQEKQDQKTPDMLITDNATEDTFYIEVSQINESEERTRTNTEHRIISNVFWNYGFDLLHSCHQLKHIDDEEMTYIINKIKAMKDEAYADKSFILFSDDCIDIAIAHPNKIEDFLHWKRMNRRENGVTGLSVDFNDTKRIISNSKIYNKVKQLPKDSTGLLHMPISYLYFLTMDRGQTIISIAEEILGYPQLLGVVLYSDIGQPMPEEEIIFQEHAISVKIINGLTRHTVFIYNHAYKGTLAEETIQRIKNSIYCFAQYRRIW